MRVSPHAIGSLVLLLLFPSIGGLLTGCDSNEPRPPDQTQINCEGTLSAAVEWETPQHIPIDLQGIASHPDIAVDGSKKFVAIHEVDTTRQFAAPSEIYALRRTETGWSEPINVSQSDTPSSRPVIATGPGGTVHLVWGERLQDATPRPGAPPDAVYYARSTDNGQTWSAPEEVFASRSDAFFSMPHSLAFDADGHLHLVFSSRESDNRPAQIRHFERMSTGWTGGRTSIGDRGGGKEPDIAIGPEGRFLVTYIAADTSRQERDRNSVFFTWSEDGGETWEKRILVHRSGFDEPGFSPTIAASSNGRIQIVWRKSLTGDLKPEALFGSCSTDGGERWAKAKNLTPSIAGQGIPSTPEVAVDERGATNVTFQMGGFNTSSFPAYHLRGIGEDWTSPQNLFGTSGAAQHVGLTSDDDGHLHLTLRMIDRDPEGVYYSIGTPQ